MILASLAALFVLLVLDGVVITQAIIRRRSARRAVPISTPSFVRVVPRRDVDDPDDWGFGEWVG